MKMTNFKDHNALSSFPQSYGNITAASQSQTESTDKRKWEKKIPGCFHSDGLDITLVQPKSYIQRKSIRTTGRRDPEP